jgi:predicted nucleic acid-binding protein
VAAAAKANADYLATHDVKHLLSHAQAIEAAYGITVLAPSELVSILSN